MCPVSRMSPENTGLQNKSNTPSVVAPRTAARPESLLA